MKKLLTYISNKWKQYSNRIFLSDTDNNLFWYKSYFAYLLKLDEILVIKLKSKNPSIIVITDSLQMRIIAFLYSFITNNDLTIISTKFEDTQIVNATISKINANVLIADKNVINKFKDIEKNQSFSILNTFTHVEITSTLLESLLDSKFVDNEYNVNRLYKKGLINGQGISIPKLTVLSPGTTEYSSFVSIPYTIIGKSISMLSYFLGLTPADKVSVIADFEFFPGIFTLLGLKNGIQYVQPTNEITTSDQWIDEFEKSNVKPNIVIIESGKFKLLWDDILLKVYSKKIFFWLSKQWLLDWIPVLFIRMKIRDMFGETVEKVHILNEELGFYCLDILKKSKIKFTSSYGYLEQGNFLAFKTTTLFKHKDFMYKPGGSILKESPDLVETIIVQPSQHMSKAQQDMQLGNIVVQSDERIMESGDLGTFVKNESSQGDRKYLYVYGRKSRLNGEYVYSYDLIEKSIKDSLLIRDCFIRKNDDKYTIYIEPRKDLLELHFINWDELNLTIEELVKDFKKSSTINFDSYAIISFDGIRNIAGKLQYYNLL